ncbi:MAG: glycoside hydrolase family 2 TIM barrel-domain containing protein [Opitutaceae bacterium]|nr:glycoside hydrolase family 2 TIM barrel-domain containing protein [Opitutaceae bacterium]
MKPILILAAAALCCGLNAVLAADSLSLAGAWRFQLDRLDAGEREGWFAQPLRDRVTLPGVLAAQGIGDPPSLETKWIGSMRNPQWFAEPEFARYATPGNFKFPYWLTPDRHYVGAAWFQRDIDIPRSWAGKRVVLTLERAHWETRVWVDGKSFGANNALATPHEYDLGQLAPGKHVLALRVDNRLIVDVGVNSHSVSDHTQGNWHGVVGKIEVRSTPLVWIDDLQAFPDLRTKSVRVRGRLGNASGKPVHTAIELRLYDAGRAGSVVGTAATTSDGPVDGGNFETTLACQSVIAAWDEFNPRLYSLTAELTVGSERDTRSVTCGFRELASSGTQFVLNGHKIFFRGTLECAIFPLTGHPPTDVASWQKVIRAAKAHGLNMLRFHSWCPPEAAFTAADELGMYLQVECSSWANNSTSLGDGKPVDAWIHAEADRILKSYGNHPSFVLLMYGNEPGGRKNAAYLANWVSKYRASDSRRLYSSGAGWPEIAENEFHVIPEPRIQAWGGGLKSRINAQPPESTTDYRASIGRRSVPVISHEIGQWCVYPNFDEIKKYTGYLKPRNFDIFRDQLAVHHMADQARAFLLASGKLQTLCYKEDIESALRTPGMGGFQLLDLHDFPGQGTALVGMLDPFWEGKGYVTAEEFRRFCNRTVPLARLAKRVFTTDETLEAAIEVAHFGPAPLERAAADWKLVDDAGKSVTRGELSPRTIPVDNGIELGRVKIDLRTLRAPARYKLVVGLRGRKFQNDWDLWVYPPKVDTAKPDGITIAEELDEQALAALQRGGRVLLLIAPERVRNATKDPVALGFSSIFWNTAWTKRQPPTTLGILCDPKAPALATFPTDFHSNYQWWYAIRHAGAMILDELPAGLRPTIQVIDDWFTARKLGLLFEARVGGGSLLVCSVDLQRELEADPVRRQLRHSLIRYVKSEQFRPRIDVTAEQIRGLMNPRGQPAVPARAR